MKIVVIEDEIRIREGLCRLIDKLNDGYEVAGTAENGQDGYELVRRVRPEIIITDIKMPLMDGLEMLTALYGEGCESKAIVLSAYSEFDYARQAMRLGVQEYLLKPIVVGDISDALLRVSEQIRRENAREKLTIDGMEQIFGGILWGGMEADDALEELLYQQYSVPAGMCYSVLCLYLGAFYKPYKEQVKRDVRELLERKDRPSYECLESEREQMLVVLLYRYQASHVLERWIQQAMLGQSGIRHCEGMGWTADVKLGSLRERFLQLCSHMEWNISLGDEVLISYPKVTGIQTSPCIYPIDVENQVKIHICSDDSGGLKKDIEDFCGYFKKGRVYEPRQIKECYVRFMWAVINVAKETGMLGHEELEQQTLLERIMGAKTQGELERTVSALAKKIRGMEETDGVHLTVKRAQSLIQEFYQSGITLEEIAAKLNITPEYLGTLFHRELGVNFSSYMKNFRITRAKELLIGTQMKLYEISDKVGYSDPKYFSRVFREVTGQLPADYRKTHK